MPARHPARRHGELGGKLQWCERSDPGGPIRHGPMVAFYPSGRKSFEVAFVDGTPRGSIRAWYDNGEAARSGRRDPTTAP